MIENSDTVLRVYEYSQLLESRGCVKFYQGSTGEGYQTLLLDGNSGTIFSVEVNPNTKQVEIRTNRNQRKSFQTEEIIDRCSLVAPLFSDYTVKDYWDLPLISLEEENNLPFCATPHERVELLMGAGEDAIEVYRTTGKVPNVDDEEIRNVEEMFKIDMQRFKQLVFDMLSEKTKDLPENIKSKYYPDVVDSEAVYSMFKRRGN